MAEPAHPTHPQNQPSPRSRVEPEWVEVDDGGYRVEFTAPAGSREGPLLDTQDPSLDDAVGDKVLWLRSYWLDGCTCNAYLLVQRDPGPDAAIHKFPPIATFETKAAKWSVVDIGDGDGFYVTAVATINGLLIQVTGNGASLQQIEGFAGTVAVEDLK